MLWFACYDSDTSTQFAYFQVWCPSCSSPTLNTLDCRFSFFPGWRYPTSLLFCCSWFLRNRWCRTPRLKLRCLTTACAQRLGGEMSCSSTTFSHTKRWWVLIRMSCVRQEYITWDKKNCLFYSARCIRVESHFILLFPIFAKPPACDI